MLNPMSSCQLHKGAMETILTENITNWHVMCTAKYRKALQWLIKTTQNIFGIIYCTSVLSVRLGDVPVQSSKDIKRQYPLWPPGLSPSCCLERDIEVLAALPN